MSVKSAFTTHRCSFILWWNYIFFLVRMTSCTRCTFYSFCRGEKETNTEKLLSHRDSKGLEWLNERQEIFLNKWPASCAEAGHSGIIGEKCKRGMFEDVKFQLLLIQEILNRYQVTLITASQCMPHTAVLLCKIYWKMCKVLLRFLFCILMSLSLTLSNFWDILEFERTYLWYLFC